MKKPSKEHLTYESKLVRCAHIQYLLVSALQALLKQRGQTVGHWSPSRRVRAGRLLPGVSGSIALPDAPLSTSRHVYIKYTYQEGKYTYVLLLVYIPGIGLYTTCICVNKYLPVGTKASSTHTHHCSDLSTRGSLPWNMALLNHHSSLLL